HQRRGLLHRRHPAGDGGRDPRPRRRRHPQQHDPARRPGGLHRVRGDPATAQRQPAGLPGKQHVDRRLPALPDHGRLVPRPAPREQVWSNYINRYYLGRETPPSDLMAWNADGTRMPYKMHSRYLRELYMENRLAECRFEVNGKPISLLDIRTPMFLVGTTGDHIAPWTSVYKMNRLTQAEVTFLLTSGGHNAGIICGPAHPKRRYQMATRKPGDKYIDPRTWAETQPVHPGSWWPAWAAWLDQRSGEPVKPPRMGNARRGYRVLGDAPGEYIFG